MPDETPPLSEVKVVQKAEAKVSEGYKIIKDTVKTATGNILEQDTVQKLWDLIEGMGQEVKDMYGGLSVITKPPQLSVYNNRHVSHTRLLVGNYVQLDNVIITGVDFDIPYLFYEDGLFDKVGVSISVAGNRKMTIKTHKWVNDILMRKRADYTEWSSTNTLNSMFES